MAGLVILILIVLACFVGVRFAPSPVEQSLLEPTSGPSAAHWFGTDELSRDSLSRVLHGGQVSLKIAFGVALLTTFIGVIIGALAGFYRGFLDELLMRFTDLWIALPRCRSWRWRCRSAASISARSAPSISVAPSG